MAVWKSQIAQVLLEHLCVPSDSSTAYSARPPPVEEISHEKPSVHMLKLMDASDNSAEGIGQVFSTIMLQGGLSGNDFYGRLQPMDGDLGTIQNFNSLRSQHTPSPYGEESLKNVIFQLGAAHTLWNISSTIFSHHFGDPSDSKNSGACRGCVTGNGNDNGQIIDTLLLLSVTGFPPLSQAYTNMSQDYISQVLPCI
ncbi:hypothetical protein PSTG_03479 [Puccinia striiformis f. sp. tritici PST-78]|uniref:DUF6589 domain-containing protein n=1 Tax=Puccinia striiformis f. sp. tritici PST-78 TaxID=1165861 RepID=A0A0L0VV89_9BASI|nr:hypothetical protein PSTG_03479 [Puccinia striiformis f. sp. tritici PST-78]